MCIYTRRKFDCWCHDYYVRFSNRCEKSLRSASGEPCPQPTDSAILSLLAKEEWGYCELCILREEAKKLAQGIANPAYTQTEEGSLRRASTTRYSDPTPNPEASSGDPEGEAQGLGLRTSNTFPQSPPPAAPYRRSDPTLVPNPFHLPKQLQRSKTSGRPPSQRSEPNQEPVEVPNPWHPQNLQRSKTSARPPSQRSEPTQVVPEVPNPFHLARSKTTAQPASRPLNTNPQQHLQRSKTSAQPPSHLNPAYIPITTHHLQPSKTTALSPLRGTKPVQVAIRDSNGFFIDMKRFEEPPQTEPEVVQRENARRQSLPLSPPPPLSERAFQSPSPHRVRPGSGSSSGIGVDPCPPSQPRDARRSRDINTRKSNRVSFVYQKGNEEAASQDLYPRPLQPQPQPQPAQDHESSAPAPGMYRESGVLRWMDGIDDDEEQKFKTNYVFSSHEDDEEFVVDEKLYGDARQPQLQRKAEPQERKERRTSVRRKSKLESRGKTPGGWVSEGEEEVLYSGDEYQTEYEYGDHQSSPGDSVKRTKTEILPQPQRQMVQQPATQITDKGKAQSGGKDVKVERGFDEEEEVLYSDGEYETDYRNSDDD